MTDTKEASEQLVRDFLGSWQARSLDTICSGFADDAIYHNVPVEPIEGIAGIRAMFQGFLDVFADARLDIVTLAAEPGRVLVERVDYFTMNDGRKVVLPVTGVFEIKTARLRASATTLTLRTSRARAG